MKYKGLKEIKVEVELSLGHISCKGHHYPAWLLWQKLLSERMNMIKSFWQRNLSGAKVNNLWTTTENKMLQMNTWNFCKYIHQRINWKHLYADSRLALCELWWLTSAKHTRGGGRKESGLIHQKATEKDPWSKKEQT